MSNRSRSPIDVAADLFVYVPIGLLSQVRQSVPELAEVGRSKLAAPLGAARVVGEMFVRQHQDEIADHIRRAGQWLTDAVVDGARSQSSTRAGETSSDNGDETTDLPDSPRSQVRVPSHLAIPEYSTLSATQIATRLRGLSREDLEAVREYESQTRKRRTVLQRIDEMLVDERPS